MKNDFRMSALRLVRGQSGVFQQGQVNIDVDWDERTDVWLYENLLFLQVWARDVEAVEDSGQDNEALYGPDTSPRHNSSGDGKPVMGMIRRIAKGRTDASITVALGTAGRHKGRRSSFVLPRLEVRVGARLWNRVESLSGSGPRDRVYVLNEEGNGRSTLEFGDGRHGARPPAGSSISVDYRFGTGRGRGHRFSTVDPSERLCQSIRPGLQRS